MDESRCRFYQEEAAEVKWLSLEEILQKISGGSFIPYEESSLNFFSLRNHQGTHTRKDTFAPSPK